MSFFCDLRLESLLNEHLLRVWPVPGLVLRSEDLNTDGIFAATALMWGRKKKKRALFPITGLIFLQSLHFLLMTGEEGLKISHLKLILSLLGTPGWLSG